VTDAGADRRAEYRTTALHPLPGDGGAGLQGFGCRGLRRLHAGAGPGFPAHRAWRQQADRPCRAGIDYQAVRGLVDQLERAGYVERVPDPSDARSRLVRITERGRQTLPLAATVVSDVETEWTEHLGKRRMGQLREILARLREITDPYASSAR
jgi:MarR family